MTSPRTLATTAFWQKRLFISDTLTRESVQKTITDYVRQSNTSVVGCFTQNPSSLTLLHWPDLREGYTEPTLKQCEQAAKALQTALNAQIQQDSVINKGEIHCMMGRRVGGYDTDTIEPIATVVKLAPHMTITEGYMVSARTYTGGVEEYGEPVAIMIGDAQYESEIHAVGDALKQHHYIIERGSDAADFYETKWAKEQ